MIRTPEAIELLFSWFGNLPFEVRHISDERTEELAVLIGEGSRSPGIGLRSNIGKFLTDLNGRNISSPSGTHVLAVLRMANDNIPGLYQIKQKSR